MAATNRKKQGKAQPKPTLESLLKRIRKIERRLNDVEYKAGHAYVGTMRIGGH